MRTKFLFLCILTLGYYTSSQAQNSYYPNPKLIKTTTTNYGSLLVMSGNEFHEVLVSNKSIKDISKTQEDVITINENLVKQKQTNEVINNTFNVLKLDIKTLEKENDEMKRELDGIRREFSDLKRELEEIKRKLK